MQEAQTALLQSLAAYSQQRNFDVFASIPVFDGKDKEQFFDWLERLVSACLQSGQAQRNEILGKTSGNAIICLVSLPMTIMR